MKKDIFNITVPLNSHGYRIDKFLQSQINELISMAIFQSISPWRSFFQCALRSTLTRKKHDTLFLQTGEYKHIIPDQFVWIFSFDVSLTVTIPVRFTLGADV